MRSSVVVPSGKAPGDDLLRQCPDVAERNRPVVELLDGHVDMRRMRRYRVVRMPVNVGPALRHRCQWQVREDERRVAVGPQDGADVIEAIDAQRPGTGQVMIAYHQDLRATRAAADALPGVFAERRPHGDVAHEDQGVVLADRGFPVGVEMRVHRLDVFEGTIRIADDVLVAQVQVRPHPRRVRRRGEVAGREAGRCLEHCAEHPRVCREPRPALSASSCASYKVFNSRGSVPDNFTASGQLSRPFMAATSGRTLSISARVWDSMSSVPLAIGRSTNLCTPAA